MMTLNEPTTTSNELDASHAEAESGSMLDFYFEDREGDPSLYAENYWEASRNPERRESYRRDSADDRRPGARPRR